MEKEGLLLSREALLGALGNCADSLDVRVLDSVDSTNTEAKRMVADGCETRTLIAARSQSGGRGRMGRSFYSPEGTGAYFSVLYRPVASVDAAVTVTCASSVAVMRAIRRLTGRACAIKWVNDLYLDEKKVCGILTECVSRGDASYIIVGIGINIRTSFEGTELAPIAGSIGEGSLSASVLIAEVVRELLPILDAPWDRGWLEEYRDCSLVLGKRITFLQNGEAREAIARSIDADGALIVECDGGEIQRLFTGEISLKMQ